MTPVLSRRQMRELDRHAIEACAVPGLVLMENAGRGATDVLVRELLEGDAAGARVAVVCGPGNNGGDGLVVARHLAARGAFVDVFLAGEPARVSGDARANLDAWRGLGGAVHALASAGDLTKLAQSIASADAVVDALFGTGLDRPIEGHHAAVIGVIDDGEAPCLAVDLPSGLDADTGGVLGVAVHALVTATFAHPKLGLLTPRGAQLAGSVHVVDLGIPAEIPAHVGASAQRLSADDLALWLAPRAPGVHKTGAGHVGIVAGSPGKIGAPQLVARGAMRAGAGLATIVTWPDAATSIEGHVLEVMTARLDPSRLPASVDAALAGKHAVVVGPGLGLDAAARAVVEHVLASFGGPVVVDADALSMFAGRPDALRSARRAIVTPHPGELARLLGSTPGAVEGDRFGAARAIVSASGAVVVLKGAHTIVAAPDGRIAVSPIACPALATAGSGDVLGGIVGALACHLAPFDAACAGVLLHGLAGESWVRTHGGADRGLLASEIADALPSRPGA